MDKIIRKGLTLRMALYLDSLLISAIMAFSAPITTTFFYSILTPEFIAAATIAFRLMGVVTSYVKQSDLMIKWLSNNFIKLVILVDLIFLTVAIFGAKYPDVRFIAYNLTCITAIKLLQTVRDNNIVNCLSGTSIVTFKAKCNTIGLLGGLFGGAIAVVTLDMVNIDVTTAMILECGFCTVAHWMQAYANMKAHKLGIIPKYEVTFSEAVNGLIKYRKKKSDVDDSIMDR